MRRRKEKHCQDLWHCLLSLINHIWYCLAYESLSIQQIHHKSICNLENIEEMWFNNRNFRGAGISCTGANYDSEQPCLTLLEAGSDTAVLVESKQRLKSQEIHRAVQVLAQDTVKDKCFAMTGPVDREDSYM